jgi:isoamylase
MLMDGRARPSGVRQRGTEATVLLVMNAHHDMVEFTLPECPGGQYWSLEIDTNIANDTPQYRGETGDVYGMTSRSLALFVRTD